MNNWRLVNSLYQIYPRSFFDTNQDGIGDIPGIIEKLDYLKGTDDSLGIDAIWISPFFPSPQADFGYDVSDYCDIDPQFGTLDDFETLLHECHERHIKVMLDYVPNHTSDQHTWFKQARQSKDNKYREYYVWRDPKPDGSPPNNWISIFGGSAWTLDETTGQYYLHSFLSEQPDLNWENPEARMAMLDVLRFWLDRGVDGFRADAVWHLSKDIQLRDEPKNPQHQGKHNEYGAHIHRYSKYGKNLFTYLREMTDVVASYEDRFIVFENYPDPTHGKVIDQYRAFYDINPVVSAPFNFEGMFVPWSAEAYAKYIRDFQDMITPDDIPIFCFSNHDQTRVVNRFGREQARLIAMLQLTMPGMPTIYYGDEIGMEDGVILPEQIQDPSARDNEMGGRDPERTPMQWSSDLHAGFTRSTTPWLPVGETYTTYNVADEQKHSDSFLSLYKQLLCLRSSDTTFRSNDVVEVKVAKESELLAYERVGDTATYRVILNFADAPRNAYVSYTGNIILATHPDHIPQIDEHGEVTLAPFEGIIVRM
ncbi:MAG: alpha-amylase family glycosyl hydrolase [Candidatus Saccharimonadales bacterium]